MSAKYYTADWVQPVDFLAMADKARAEKRQEEQDLIALTRAGNAALRALAEHMYPKDFADMGERWNMPVLMRELWVRAYVHGWRDALAPAAVLGDQPNDPSGI